MTPLLLLSIFIIFIAAWLNPLGPIEETSIVYQNGPFIEGLLQGYLALDGFAALIFAIIMINTFKDQGVTEHKQVVHYTVIVGVVAVVLLCLVYGALCFVGAQTSGMTAFSNGGVILNYAVYALFGRWGNLILGVAVVLACLTTSIGLTTAFGDYFAKVLPNLSYRKIITVVILCTWLVSNVGLDTLIDTVLPVLLDALPDVPVAGAQVCGGGGRRLSVYAPLCEKPRLRRAGGLHVHLFGVWDLQHLFQPLHRRGGPVPLDAVGPG